MDYIQEIQKMASKHFVEDASHIFNIYNGDTVISSSELEPIPSSIENLYNLVISLKDVFAFDIYTDGKFICIQYTDKIRDTFYHHNIMLNWHCTECRVINYKS